MRRDGLSWQRHAVWGVAGGCCERAVLGLRTPSNASLWTGQEFCRASSSGANRNTPSSSYCPSEDMKSTTLSALFKIDFQRPTQIAHEVLLAEA